MLSVTLYEFKKRENSTKRPDDSVTQKVHEALLKEQTSLLYPRLIFDFGLMGNPAYYNYAYITDLGNRYYFIREWTALPGHLWEASLEVDVLASWKVSIGDSSQYVTRSSYTFDGRLCDMLYPAKTQPKRVVSSLENPFVTSFEDGTFLIGIINSESDDAIGSVHYYAFTQSQFNNFCSYLLGSDWTGITDISEELTKAIFDPFQYIVSCIWYPLEIPIKAVLPEMRFGWWTLPVAGGGIPAYQILTANANFTLPKHPQASARGAYLNSAPYSAYELFYPGIGKIVLDSNILAANEKLGTILQIDIIGNKARLATLAGTTDDATPIDWTFGQIGVPIQLSQLRSDLLNNIGTAATSFARGAKAYATGDIAGTIAGGTSFLTSAIDILNPKVSSLSGNGSLIALKSNIVLVAEFQEVADEDNENRGRPLCAVKQLSTIPGYQVIADPDIALASTSEENRKVKNYMTTGYFYE